MRLIDEIAANTSGGPLFKCKACGATGDPYDGFCRTCGYLLSKDEMLKRADALIERDIQSRTPYPIRGLAYIRGVGRIDLEVGKKGSPPGYDYGTGLSKLLKKHREEIKNLALTLVLGKTAKSDEEDRLIRVHGDRFAAIGKRPFGGSIITHYKDAKKAASFESRPVNAGAVGRLSLPTLHPNLALADGIGVAASDGYYRIFPSLKSRGDNTRNTNAIKRRKTMTSTNPIVQNALMARAVQNAIALMARDRYGKLIKKGTVVDVDKKALLPEHPQRYKVIGDIGDMFALKALKNGFMMWAKPEILTVV